MEGNNTFFDSYKKKLTDENEKHIEKSADNKAQGVSSQETPPASGSQKSSMRYDIKSGFIKPEKKASTAVIPANAKTKRIITAAAIGAGIILCAAIAVFFLLNQSIEVVDLTGWTENNAQLWAREHGVILQIEEQYSDEVEAGKVIAQSTPAGTKIKKGDFIKLTVSLGYDLSVTFPIPDFMSMTKSEIEKWAADNHMTKVRITTEYSDEVEAGKVIRYEINDERVIDEVRRDTPIYIVVSKGPEDETAVTITVPNFKQMAISECYAFASENEIILTVEEQYDDYIPAGSVISQSIKPEEKVSKGTEIVLMVSKGKLITVPDFSGYSKEKAAAVAGQLGIPITIRERYSSYPVGAFISQSIKAGSEYNTGDILEINYSLGNEIVLQSFVGQTRDLIENWAKELNAQGASIRIKAVSTPSNSPKGTIIHQDKANTVIGVNSTVNITVSSGKIIFVPDFVAPEGSGYDVAITREKAIAMCEELNIVPIFEKASKPGRLPGEIWSQSIAAGTEVAEGTKIVLKYVPVSNVQVPNFINMTKEEIMAGNFNRMFDIRFETGTEYVDGYAGKVYSQSLTANTYVTSGSVITLTIGPEQTLLPPPGDG
jgi:beta-lactam-binding protein with PASTA domain